MLGAELPVFCCLPVYFSTCRKEGCQLDPFDIGGCSVISAWTFDHLSLNTAIKAGDLNRQATFSNHTHITRYTNPLPPYNNADTAFPLIQTIPDNKLGSTITVNDIIKFMPDNKICELVVWCVVFGWLHGVYHNDCRRWDASIMVIWVWFDQSQNLPGPNINITYAVFPHINNIFCWWTSSQSVLSQDNNHAAKSTLKQTKVSWYELRKVALNAFAV